jgi:hypothetical protein
MAETDRNYGEEYKISISEEVNVIDQYKQGTVEYSSGGNRGEFPYRSVIRGDFESKYCGTVSWAALQKFKTHLLDKVLSYKGKKLPEVLWKKALDNYIYNRLIEIEAEKTRYTYQTTSFYPYVDHRFFTVGNLSGFSYNYRTDVDQVFDQPISIRRQKRLSFVEEIIDSVCWKYVGKDGVDKRNPFDLDWKRDPLWTVPDPTVAKETITITESSGVTNRFYVPGDSGVLAGKVIEFPSGVIGGVNSNDVYYIKNVYVETIPDPGDPTQTIVLYKEFTISDCLGGPAVQLTTETKSVNALISILETSPIIPNIYTFDRLGESDEFSLYFPEYQNTFTSNTVNNRIELDGLGNPITVYVSTSYTGNEYSDIGLLNDMAQHIQQLADLKYDYSNLDEILTKEWLYLKLSTPNIEELGTNEVMSTQPYYNEVYIDHKLADVYLLFVLEDNPPLPADDSGYCDPDFIVRDKWKTREPGKGLFSVDGVDLEKIRPQAFEYQYRDKTLIYNRSNFPKLHGPDDPKLVAGEEYEFSTVGGQPNNEVISKFKFTPMRLRLKCEKPIRDEFVFFIDSTAYDTESKIAEIREKVIPVVLDRRLTYYDNNPGTGNRVIVDYNVNVTKEFPWMADLL